MKKAVLIVLVVALGIAGYIWYKSGSSGGGDKGPKQQPVTLKKHSDEFNKAVASAMNAYFDMKAAFVEADTAKVKENCRKFIQLMDAIPLNELKSDTAGVYVMAQNDSSNIKANAVSLLTQTEILEMRKDFGMISENLYPSFFRTINYEGEKLYWQYCPMAYGEDKGASWVSNTKEIINPYMGKNHPEHKNTMLHCGEIKDTIKAQ